MKILLTTLNAKYIHKNLALRWLYVAGSDRRNTEIKEFTINDETDDIVAQLSAHPAQVIAFSIYIWNISKTMEVIRTLKASTGKHIIIGGPEVSYDSFFLMDQGVDAIMLGEGEKTFWKYIDMLKKKRFRSLNGVYTRMYPNKKLAIVSLKDNEKYPSPYFLKLDQKEMDKRILYFETSRGCPFSCEYCLSGSDCRVRYFSEEYLFAALKRISHSKVKIVKVLDRTFNTRTERALSLVRYINENCKNQVFQFEIVAELLHPKIIDFMVNEMDKSRFRFEVGVQSFNNEALEAVGRHQNNQKLIQVIKKLRNAGVIMHVDLIAGLPYEDLFSFQKSFNRLYELQAKELQLGVLKLLKGTTMKEKYEMYDMHFNPNAPYDVISTHWMSENNMIQLNKCAYAVEKYYNSGLCCNSISTILRLKYSDNPFSLYMQLGEQLSLISRPYSRGDLFMCLKKVVSGDDEIINSILKDDYYNHMKRRVKSVFSNPIDKIMRKKINRLVLDKKILDEYNLYHYTHADSFYRSEYGYQLIVYSPKEKEPVRYFIDVEIKEIIKI